MKRPIRPDWLLRQATELAGHGVGQPRHANLRRAVSASYYALFHELTWSTMAYLIPGGTEVERQRACRRLSHKSLEQAASWIAGATPPDHLGDVVVRLRANQDISDVALAFGVLKEARESADYDHEAELTRPDVHARVAQAERAVRLLRLRRNTQDDFKAFFGLVALRA